jgi:hypothetical protein
MILLISVSLTLYAYYIYAYTIHVIFVVYHIQYSFRGKLWFQILENERHVVERS